MNKKFRKSALALAALAGSIFSANTMALTYYYTDWTNWNPGGATRLAPTADQPSSPNSAAPIRAPRHCHVETRPQNAPEEPANHSPISIKSKEFHSPTWSF